MPNDYEEEAKRIAQNAVAADQGINGTAIEDTTTAIMELVQKGQREFGEKLISAPQTVTFYEDDKRYVVSCVFIDSTSKIGRLLTMA